MGKSAQAQQNYGVLLNTLVASLFMGPLQGAAGNRTQVSAALISIQYKVNPLKRFQGYV